MPKPMQPYTFEYNLVAGETILESKLQHTKPFLYKSMPFNFVNVQAEEECIFYINQDPSKALKLLKGGGSAEADGIALWSWMVKNLASVSNKIYVTVQRE